MRRRHFTIVSAVSLVLCVATCVLWLWARGKSTISGANSPYLDIQDDTKLTIRPDAAVLAQRREAGRDWGLFIAGLGVGELEDHGGWIFGVSVPYWLVIAITATLPIRWMTRRSRPFKATGRCSACGYDLRASRDRCPECGAVPTVNPAVLTRPATHGAVQDA